MALGFSARLRDSSLLQFLVAGRNLTLPLFVATLVCTWYGGILGMGESVSYYGFGTWLLLGVPYYLFATAFALFFAKRVRGAPEISLPERLTTTFGPVAGGIGALLVFLLAVPSAHVLMLGILVELFTGWPLWLSVAVAGVGGSLFLYKGGLMADVRASLLAFAMMYIGFGALVAYCWSQSPPWQAFSPLLSEPRGTFTGGQGWLTIVTFLILGAWTLVDPGFHQRVASAADPSTSRRGVLVSVGFWALFDVLSITTGLYAITLLKEPPANPLMFFPLLAEMALPPGLKAVFLCGIFGTVLCAMVGYALVSGATFGREMIGAWRPGLSDQQLKNLSRVGIALGVALAIVIGASVASVVQLWYNLGGLVTGALLIPVALSYLRPQHRFRPGWIAASMLIGALASLAWWIHGARTGNAWLTVDWNGQSLTIGTLLPALTLSAAVLALGSLFPKKETVHG